MTTSEDKPAVTTGVKEQLSEGAYMGALATTGKDSIASGLDLAKTWFPAFPGHPGLFNVFLGAFSLPSAAAPASNNVFALCSGLLHWAF